VQPPVLHVPSRRRTLLADSGAKVRVPDCVRLRSNNGCLVAPERQRASRDLLVPGKWRVSVEDHLLQNAGERKWQAALARTPTGRAAAMERLLSGTPFRELSIRATPGRAGF